MYEFTNNSRTTTATTITRTTKGQLGPLHSWTTLEGNFDWPSHSTSSTLVGACAGETNSTGSRQITRRTIPREQKARSLTFFPFSDLFHSWVPFLGLIVGRYKSLISLLEEPWHMGDLDASAVQNPRGAEIKHFLVEGEAQTSRGLPETQYANN